MQLVYIGGVALTLIHDSTREADLKTTVFGVVLLLPVVRPVEVYFLVLDARRKRLT